MRITRLRLDMLASTRKRSRTSSPRPAMGSSTSLSGRCAKTASISSSSVAATSASDSALGSSAAKLGSLGSEASRTCIEPMTSPSRSSAPRKRAGSPASEESANSRAESPASDESANDQPSSSAGTKRVTMPSVESIRRPECSKEPSSSGMFTNPCSPRKRSSSTSGLSPAVSNR